MWNRRRKMGFMEKCCDDARRMMHGGRKESSMDTGLALGLIGGAIGILAVTAYLVVRHQGGDPSFGQQGQEPSRSHIILSSR